VSGHAEHRKLLGGIPFVCALCAEDRAVKLQNEVLRLRSLILHRINRQWDHGRGCTPCDDFEKVAEPR